ncbi:proprotein convertase P-domain-containing protein [Ahniella affigens]|nr:proprotein convertase P-domain-containing protein [Ahniella affigens]
MSKFLSKAGLALMALGLNGAALAAKDPMGPNRALHEALPKVADLRTVDVTLDQALAKRQGAALGAEIRTLDASFIKVHFDYFNLPSGLSLEVASDDGSEVYRYSNKSRDGHTVDPSLGQDGRFSFSAMSVHGPAANLRIVGKAKEAWTSAHGVRVSRYLEGYPEALIAGLMQDDLLSLGNAPKAICGVDDKRGVACYQSSDATAFDRSRPVARLVLSGGGLCTTWRVGPNNHLFTNNHCFATQSEVAAAEVWFNYQAAACGGTSSATTTKVTGATMLKTDATLDYTLYTVNNFANLASFGYLGLDNRLPVQGEEIFIPQHPGGRLKELGVVSDHRSGGRCIVDTAVQNGTGTNTDAGYKCDTEGGSSGSPVIARSSNKVIALHHLGGCNNSGAHISKIWPQVATYFNNVVPGGDIGGGTPTNQAPTANFTFSSSGLTATFTDSSTDSDGTISSRSWNFGDGTTSTATSPSKTYAAAGTYNVSLTVTDNAGATNTKTSAVTVSSGTALMLTNGVPVNNLAVATAGNSITYVMNVPAHATNLKFVMSGGTGDADMYVRLNAAPTTTTYDCRPYQTGNAETCNIATATPGTYYVMLRAYSAFSGVTLTGSYSISNFQTYSNSTVQNINDNTTINSPITVSGRSGNAPSAATVSVNITHTYQGDLKVDLVAPDGTLYNIHNRTGSGTDNIIKSMTLNLSSELLNGTWNLRVQDAGAGDTGKLNSWSISF